MKIKQVQGKKKNATVVFVGSDMSNEDLMGVSMLRHDILEGKDNDFFIARVDEKTRKPVAFRVGKCRSGSPTVYMASSVESPPIGTDIVVFNDGSEESTVFESKYEFANHAKTATVEKPILNVFASDREFPVVELYGYTRKMVHRGNVVLGAYESQEEEHTDKIGVRYVPVGR